MEFGGQVKTLALCYVPQTILNGICGVTEHIILLRGGSTISGGGAIGAWSAVMFQALGSSMPTQSFPANVTL